MTQPVTLIDRLRMMRAQLECPHCRFPMTWFEKDTLDDAITLIAKLELALSLEDGAENKIVVEERP